MKQVFYFSPHQDDEVTNFGAASVTTDREKGLLFLNERVQVKDSTVHVNGMADWETNPELSGLLFADPSKLEAFVTSGKDELALMRVPSGQSVVFYAGAAWGQQRTMGHYDLGGGYFRKRLPGMSWAAFNEMYDK